MTANHDNELNPLPEPSEEALHAICAECPKEYHVNDLVDGIRPECRPCGECEGEGCDECMDWFCSKCDSIKAVTYTWEDRKFHCDKCFTICEPREKMVA